MTVTCWRIDLSKLGDSREKWIDIQTLFVAEARSHYLYSKETNGQMLPDINESSRGGTRRS